MKSVKELGFSVLKRGARWLYTLGAEKWIRRVPGALSAYRLAYRSLRPEGEVVVTVQGRKMYLDPTDTGMGSRLITLGIFEPVETGLFSSLITKGKVVVDIGANIGFYTLLAADLVGDQGKVIAFEPVPRNVALLRKSIEANGYKNVTVVPMAVADKRGVAELLVDDQNWGYNRIAEATGQSGNGTSLQVETVTLDDFFARSGERVDIIKIDAEGAEVAILDGAMGLLARNPNVIILTEYNPKLIQAFGKAPATYLRKLAACGFEFFCLDEVAQQRRTLPVDAIDEFTEHLLEQPPGGDFVNLLCLRGQSTAAWDADLLDRGRESARVLTR